MLNSKKLLPMSIAVAACLAAPVAFAQSLGVGVNAGGAARVETPAASVQSQGSINADAQANPQSAIPAVPATPAVPPVNSDSTTTTTTEAQAATPAVPATPATPAKKGWSELDANGNGSLSATEAAPMESLSKVFVTADADANGELTQDEYKTWLAANGKAKAKGKAKHGGG